MSRYRRRGRPATGVRPLSYACRAIQETLASGFTPQELAGVLGPFAPTDLVPPRLGEGVPEYGRRAAGEIMVRYLLS